MAIPNHWNAFNLRQSPFFQDTLWSGVDARYPLELFVGREAESGRILRGIFGAADSRQVVTGAPGRGKTTLAQYVKSRAAAKGFFSNAEPVSVMSTERADGLLVRILGYVYDTLYSFSGGALAREEAMQAAQQLVLAFRVQSGGGDVSFSFDTPAGGFGLGVGRSKAVTYQQSAFVSPVMVVPKLLSHLMALGRSKLKGCEGIVIHMNNMENLSDADGSATGMLLRDLRDLFLKDGYHYLLVGTPDIVRTAIAPHAQLRSVFMVSEPLPALTFDEFLLLLRRRYRHLKLNSRRPVTEPVIADVLRELYELFAGDLRGVLNALDYGADLLLGYTGRAPASPMGASDIHSVLRLRYRAEAQARLSESSLERLDDRAGAVDESFTQAELTAQWRLSQAFVSRILAEWQRFGYARESGRDGRKLTYELTGPARIMLSAPADRAPRRRK
jgi:hypothetical protein